VAVNGRRRWWARVARSGANSGPGERISEEVPQLRLLAPVRLNVVCFTLADEPSEERVHALAHAVAASGEAFVTPTFYGGTHALRAAFSNWRTSEADTDRVFNALKRSCADLLP
jgi:selenocysteine lyase/cysteine desulfurase